MRRLFGILTAAVVIAGTTAASPAMADRSHPHQTSWTRVDAPTDQQLRGLDAVSGRIAWVGGSAGGVFRTTDGGQTWDEVFVNDDEAAFYDCMAMYPGDRFGLAVSDPVDGKFRIISTRDGGASWQLVDPAGMPDAVEGEFGFAASGTCLVTSGHDAYLASGGGAARVFVSHDRGVTWEVHDSTIPASPAGGVFSLAFRGGHGIAVGGDFLAPEVGTDASAFTNDRGRTWTNGGDLSGYRSGVDWIRHGVAVAVGPTGTDLTRDGGRSWTAFDDLALDAVQCVRTTCWASGPNGVVVRARLH